MRIAICIPTVGRSHDRIRLLLESLKKYTFNDYKVFVRDDGTENKEQVALTEYYAERNGATFFRGTEWGYVYGNLEALGNAVVDDFDIIVFLSDDCLVSHDWLGPIVRFYEWNENLKPGMVSGVMIEAWELALSGLLEVDEYFYRDPDQWSGKGILLRENLTFSQEAFNIAIREERIKTVSKYEPMGPIIDGKFKLDHPVPLSGGLGPCFSISSKCYKEIKGFTNCEFTGCYEAMLGFKAWQAGYTCCMIPSPPIYHARGVGTREYMGTDKLQGVIPREVSKPYWPWWPEAQNRWLEKWGQPFGVIQTEIQKKYQEPASEVLKNSRFTKRQTGMFPTNLEYDNLLQINQGPLHWRDERQQLRMNWIAKNCINSVLDVGCATGGLLDFLSSDITYVGVDFDRTRIDEGREKYGLRARFYVMDATYGLPFLSKSLKTAVCADMLEHIPRGLALGVINELSRIAEKRVVLTFPGNEEVNRNVDHIWYCDLKTVQDLLTPFEDNWTIKTEMTNDFILVLMERING